MKKNKREPLIRVVNSNQMKEVEQISSDTYSLSEDLIIENVGREAADYLEKKYLEKEDYQELVFLIGKGNNGADALCIARNLAGRGYSSRAFLLFPDSTEQEILNKQLKMAKAFGVKITPLSKSADLFAYFSQTQESYFIVDGIFGMNFRPPLSDSLFEIINAINKYGDKVISVDIPSGVHAETGQLVGNAVFATETLCVGPAKTGFFADQGIHHVGHLHFLTAGLPPKLIHDGDETLLLSEKLIPIFLRERSHFSYKNTFGHLLAVGGSPGLTGAITLASSAALSVGTGLVTSATWKESFNELQGKILPEVMTGIIPEQTEEFKKFLKEDLQKYDAIILGPGMGVGEKTRQKVLSVLNSYSGPVLLDADALKSLSIEKDKALLNARKSVTIFTPHFGEFAQFMGITVEELQKNPIDYLKSMVEQTKSFVVMKGAVTFVGSPEGKVLINNFPNNGMAKGGSGDVLAGILGGFLAQISREHDESLTFPIIEKELALGVLLHSEAGRIAAHRNGVRSMTPTSLIQSLSQVFLETEQRSMI